MFSNLVTSQCISFLVTESIYGTGFWHTCYATNNSFFRETSLTWTNTGEQTRHTSQCSSTMDNNRQPSYSAYKYNRKKEISSRHLPLYTNTLSLYPVGGRGGPTSLIIQSNMSMHHYECVALCFVNILQ